MRFVQLVLHFFPIEWTISSSGHLSGNSTGSLRCSMTGSRFGSLGGSITGTRFDFRNVDIRFHHTQLSLSRFLDITFWVTIIAFLVQNEWTISRSGSTTCTQFDFRNVDIRFHRTQLLLSRFSDITFWVTLISFQIRNLILTTN